MIEKRMKNQIKKIVVKFLFFVCIDNKIIEKINFNNSLYYFSKISN